VVAIYTIGCLIGALASTAVANPLGRRRALVVFAIIATIGIILQGTSFSLGQLVVGRIISGIGVGGVNAVVPVWQSECTKPKNRGKSVVVIGIFIASGVAMASWVSFGFSFYQHSSICWRLPLLVPMIFCSIIALSAMLFPESPRWLVQKGRYDEAKVIISILEDVALVSEHIVIEIDSIREACNKQASHERGFLDLFKIGPERLLYRSGLAILINFCAQMTGKKTQSISSEQFLTEAGANLITYYATTIFRESLGFANHEASVLAAGLLTWKIVAASLAYYFIDRAGRKPLFMISGFGMGLAMMCLAITVSELEHSGAGPASTFFLFMFMFFFPLGFLGANFLYSAEIAPQELRIHLSAIGTSAHWLFNFVIAEVTPIAFATIGYRYYIVFACTGVAVVPMVYFLFPETNGRSLEEMDRIFSAPEHWWQVTAAARRLPRSGLEDVENFEKDEKASHVEKAAIDSQSS